MSVLNARMYAVTPEVALLWRELLERVGRLAEVKAEWLDYPAPAPLEELWQRADLAAVFMCGLPFSLARPAPLLLAAPVPSLPDYAGKPCYWSELVVAKDGSLRSLDDTFGKRIAFTDAGSQSGYAAPIALLEELVSKSRGSEPLYREIVGPVVTPLGALRAVIDGKAEVAPIDSYAFDLLRRYRPTLTSQVRSIARTPATASPVLVATPQSLNVAQIDKLRRVLQDVHRDAACIPLLRDLLLQRFAMPNAADYVALGERYERARRYWGSHALGATVPSQFLPPGSQSA